jgi:hypothetical protein
MRWQSVLLTACSAVALAGCGGGEKNVERRVDTTPRIQRALADQLASRSDNVASLLDSGDSCGAAAEAARLRAEVTASIGAIPDLYVEDLSGLVNEIQAQIPPCQEKPADDEDDGTKEHKKEKKKHKHDDEGDD